MDYRLVKQFSNNAIDNFFNFFYKIADFIKVLIDLFWAFADIWYQFFMIFINAWLYFYYLLLFFLDKMSMSRLFSRKAAERFAMPGSRVYRPDIVVPVHPMYGKIELPKPKIAEAVAQVVAPKSPKVRGGSKKSISRSFAEGVLSIFRGISRSVSKVFKNVALALGGKLRPVREEEPAQKKSLIDEYMKEYERKKRS
jgi:hypothetical protein